MDIDRFREKLKDLECGLQVLCWWDNKSMQTGEPPLRSGSQLIDSVSQEG